MATGKELVEAVEHSLGRQITDRRDAMRRLDNIPDASMREELAKLLWGAEVNEADPGFRARREADDKRKAREHREYLEMIAERAVNGWYGPDMQGLADAAVSDGRGGTLRLSEDELERLRHAITEHRIRTGDTSNDPPVRGRR